MSNSCSGPLTVVELRRLRDRTEALPPGPWAAVEISHLELHGPAAFDPDIDLDERAWRANEQRRAATAAWRGIRASDGTRILGEPLAGGRPMTVHCGELLWLADVRTVVPQLLATLRSLWPRPPRPAAAITPTRAAAATTTATPARLNAAARAAYEREPGIEKWDELSGERRRAWVARIEAALAVLQDAGTD